MKFKINSKLLPIKAHYFLIFAGTAPIVPFLPIYAKQLGFDSVGVGIIYAGTKLVVYLVTKLSYLLKY